MIGSHNAPGKPGLSLMKESKGNTEQIKTYATTISHYLYITRLLTHHGQIEESADSLQIVCVTELLSRLYAVGRFLFPAFRMLFVPDQRLNECGYVVGRIRPTRPKVV